MIKNRDVLITHRRSRRPDFHGRVASIDLLPTHRWNKFCRRLTSCHLIAESDSAGKFDFPRILRLTMNLRPAQLPEATAECCALSSRRRAAHPWDPCGGEWCGWQAIATGMWMRSPKMRYKRRPALGRQANTIRLLVPVSTQIFPIPSIIQWMGKR